MQSRLNVNRVCVVVGLFLALPLPAQTPPQTIIPATGCLFGMHAQSPDFKKDPISDMNAINAAETMIGRRFDVDRQYYAWDSPIPTAYESWTASQGRIPLISWFPSRDGAYVRWGNIANGSEDATINARADAFKIFGSPIVVAFHHEPEDEADGQNVPRCGTPPEFIAAFHIVLVFRARGVTNVLWTCILYGSDYRDGNVVNFCPGDDVVDIPGADGYNFYPDRPDWVSFGQVFNAFRNFGVAHAKPLFIAEYGCQEDPAVPDRRAQWIADAEATLKQWPEIKAVCYFNAIAGYNWRIESTASSMSAFTTMGADTYFKTRPAALTSKRRRALRH